MLKTQIHSIPKIRLKRPEKEPKKGNWKVIILILFALIFLSLGASLLYDDVVKRDESGEIIGISDKYQDRFREDSVKLNHCVQYVLLARSNGWYERCDTTLQGKIYLYEGEVWKYGITCESNPSERYSQDFYQKHNLVFRRQFYGNRLECEIEEKRKLYH